MQRLLILFSLGLLAGLLATGLGAPGLAHAWQVNRAYREVALALFTGAPPGRAEASLGSLAVGDAARAAWGRARLAKTQGLPAEGHYLQALASAAYLPLVRAAEPQNESLADAAFSRYPGDARASAWAGDALFTSNPGKALLFYQQAVASDPQDNLSWRRIADLTDQDQPHLAVEAARQACRLNPRAAGTCYQEARLAYRLGDWQRAVKAFGLIHANNWALYAEDWAQYILALQYLGRTDEAARRFAEAQAAAPADYAALLQRYARPTP